MRDLNSSVLRLAREICAGRCSPDKTRTIISNLEEQYGDWDMPVELPDKGSMSQQEYLKVLTDTVKAGVFSKNALIEMSITARELYGDKGKVHISQFDSLHSPVRQ